MDISLMEPIDIDIGDGRSVAINYSGGLSEYRYDIYQNRVIIGAMGVDVIIEDVTILNIAVDKYLDSGGRF